MKFTLAVAGAMAASATANPILSGLKGDKKGDVSGPFEFTSTYEIKAVPEQVVDSDDEFTGGLEGATGLFKFGINSKENVICYNITLENFRGDYESPANTATHIHEAPAGEAGPPRLAFKNPEEICGTNLRRSVGCLTGPFLSGVLDDNDVDTADGFHVKQIEENPSAFFADTHSSEAVPGAVRGQMDQ